MRKKNKCLIFIDADIICRHFIDSNAFKDLIKFNEVQYIFPEKDNKRLGNVNISTFDRNVKKIRINHYPNRLKIWRQLLFVDQMKIRLGSQNISMRYFRKKTLKWKASLIYTFIGLPIIWSFFKKIKYFQLKNRPNLQLNELISNFKPDVIIHPCVLEGLFLNDLILITKDKKIPLIVIMNSWDNPSTKRAVIGKPDWLLVWGKQTYNHSLKYMRMSEKNIIKFGSAQFDIYNSIPKYNKKQFRKYYGLDNNTNIILYAGSSKGTNEIKHLELINNAIQNDVIKNTIIIYRPHPWGHGGRNGHLLLDQKWTNIIIDKSMINYLKDVKNGNIYRYLSDYKDTHQLLYSVDAVISPLSTILIEAAINGKPSLCFLPYSDKSLHFQLDNELIHFKEFFQNVNFLKAFGYNELIPKIINLNELIKKPNIDVQMKKEANFFVKAFDNSFSIRLNEFVQNLLKTY